MLGWGTARKPSGCCQLLPRWRPGWERPCVLHFHPCFLFFLSPPPSAPPEGQSASWRACPLLWWRALLVNGPVFRHGTCKEHSGKVRRGGRVFFCGGGRVLSMSPFFDTDKASRNCKEHLGKVRRSGRVCGGGRVLSMSPFDTSCRGAIHSWIPVGARVYRLDLFSPYAAAAADMTEGTF